ncbi:nuclear mitotic apparatus protein 1 isoform X1 [Hoplias malabaricus]|uniref:nuclear mitotic apparatus protein 1 isoform X1 n=1 Tax=Hoplias malabaricus TaxID=27720 RepID=UPI00346241E7
MTLHQSKEAALLAWINGLLVGERVQTITGLKDGAVLLKLVYKLKGEEPSKAPVHLPESERMSIVFTFLRSVYENEQCIPLTEFNSNDDLLDLQLAKVLLLLCYYGLNERLLPQVTYETEIQMAAMFHLVRSGSSLSEALDKLLTSKALIHCSSTSSESSYSDGSPFFARSRSPLVTFLELNPVASTSFVSSPIQDLMNTPQVQLRKLRKDLVREGDIRDELERELSERITTISERETEISQLQHRLQRVLRDKEQMEQENRTALLELQQKNDGLLARVHEVLKQCHDLKTDNKQKDNRIDKLLEENGSLAAQIRNAFAQLARAEEAVSKLTEAHESSQTEWGNRRETLLKELSKALSDRESLSEQIQILQSKISVLEDELSKVSTQVQEKGEVLGPVMEREKLKQELADLTLKLSQLEETISRLEREKLDTEELLLQERTHFERETLRLQGLISDLQQSVNSIQAEREAQEVSSREYQMQLTAQIAALESELAHLKKLEVQLAAEISLSAELRKQRGELEAKVTSLENTVNSLRTRCKGMEVECESQQEVLNVLRADLQKAQTSLVEYEGKLSDHKKVVEENASLHARISALDKTVAVLQNEIDGERERGQNILAFSEQQKAQMEDKFRKQEEKSHEMFAELETLSQELHKMKQQKLEAQSCIEKLTEEGKALRDNLAEERDQAQSQLELVKKAKDEAELKLQHIITENQRKISQLQAEIEETVASLKQSESEMFALKDRLSTKEEHLHLQQQELARLQSEAEVLQTKLLEQEGNLQQLSHNVTSRDMEIQKLKVELNLKGEEIQSLKSTIQSLETESSEMRDLLQKEVEEQRLTVSHLKSQLAEAESLISLKDKALEDLAQNLKNLTEELSTEKDRAATLETVLKAAKKDQEIGEQTLKLDMAQLRQEIEGHLKHLEELLAEIKSLKEQIRDQQYTVLQKEQEASILDTKYKALEENFCLLQNKLAEATTLAMKSQSELLTLQTEAEHQESIRDKAQEIEETQRKELQRQVTELQTQVNELTSQASERESFIVSLQEKMKEQEDLKQKLLQESEAALQRELEKVVALQGQLESVVHQVAAKNELLESTDGKLKWMELLCQQKESIISETSQARETLEKTVTELCTKQNQELDKYQKELETLQKEKEQLTSVSTSLQNQCQVLQATNKGQQDALSALKADLQNTQNEYKKDLETLKYSKEQLQSVNQSLQNECQSLKTGNQEQQEALNTLKTDFQNTREEYKKKQEILKKEKEQLGLVNQSLQTECQKFQAEVKEQQHALNTLKANLQKTQEEHQKEVETLTMEKDQLSSTNQSLQTECQSLQAEVKEQKNALNILKANLQDTQEGYQKELDTFKMEKDQLSSVNQSLQTDCQKFQAEVKEQQHALNTLKANLQKTQEEHQKELETFKMEKDQLSSVNQSLQTDCQNLQAEVKEQQNTLDTLKANIQKTLEEHQKELETFKMEKDQLSSVNQSLQTDCQKFQAEIKEQQHALNTLKANLQKTQEEHQKELETFKIEKDQLSSVNQSLQAEVKEQKDALNILKANLQDIQEGYQKELDTFKMEKDQLSSVNQSLQTDCQKFQAEIKEQQHALNTLKANLQKTQEEHQKDLETFKMEKDQLSSVNQSLKTECQNMQAKVKVLLTDLQNTKDEQKQKLETLSKEKDHLLSVNISLECQCQSLQLESKRQQEALISIKADFQNTEDRYMKDQEMLKEESKHLSSINQTLQTECKSLQAELTSQQSTQDKYKKDLETLNKEKDNLLSVNQFLQRECDASGLLQNELEGKLAELNESVQLLKELVKQRDKQVQELQEELKVKTEAVEHYKVQMDKAKTHYNCKKQLLVEEQEARQALQISLETNESEVKALRTELKLASMELENAKVSEKNLLVKVKNLETQLSYADLQLREQRKQADTGAQVKHKEDVCLKVPVELQNTSTDSLELDLDDSLNVAGKPAIPGESSTPLLRSSERLAAKRRTQDQGSLETLYFTPMNPRGKKHDILKHQDKLETSIISLGDLTLDSAKKLQSSAKRRRTTQVINITMTKKAPGEEAEESFYSLHASQSQPNLATQKSRPISLGISEEQSSSDKLLGLPGYRRSNVHGTAPPRATSTFCVGSEYEPEHVADDWMRIAELQSRNKACLPHLKSSYPLESRPSLGFSVLPVTDEDVRFGDPEETIRRASMAPGQLMDTLSSHRLSLAPPLANRDHASSQPQRYSMLPGQISTSTAALRSSQQNSRASTKAHSAKTYELRTNCSPLAPKRPASQIQDPDTPEAKKLASCFPRPATPKNRFPRSTASGSQNRPPSPADRRQSMAFVIDNTPKKPGRVDSRLQRGINKLRNSARKSPGSSRKTSSAAAAAKTQSPFSQRTQRKSPRINTKSPKIPTSAKKNLPSGGLI